MATPIRQAAVLGHPISHSLSPVLHQAAYSALGLDWHYGRHDVDESELAAFLGTLDDSWAGLSLTMPLKAAVFAHLDHIDPLATVTGAVNTVVFSGKGSGRMMVGANTDVYGIVAALKEGGLEAAIQRTGRTAILGAGATAASALAALAELGDSKPLVFVRSLGRTAALRMAAQRMGVEPEFVALADAAQSLGSFDAVVSTLPPHAADGLAEQLVNNGNKVRGVLLDVAYDPAPTALIEAWRELANEGSAAITGERMLLHQAGEQVRLMTGHPAPIAQMSAALNTVLGY